MRTRQTLPPSPALRLLQDLQPLAPQSVVDYHPEQDELALLQTLEGWTGGDEDEEEEEGGDDAAPAAATAAWGGEDGAAVAAARRKQVRRLRGIGSS